MSERLSSEHRDIQQIQDDLTERYIPELCRRYFSVNHVLKGYAQDLLASPDIATERRVNREVADLGQQIGATCKPPEDKGYVVMAKCYRDRSALRRL